MKVSTNTPLGRNLFKSKCHHDAYCFAGELEGQSDPLKKREEFAISLRKQKRAEIIQKKRRQVTLVPAVSAKVQEEAKESLI
jgi:hypothetical protein